MQHFGKSALRVAKNYTKGYSDTQAKVRDATSNDAWGPSGTQMNEIAQMTYNQNDFVEIMEMLDKRLNDKGKNWRHVFKSLTVLDYCLHAGSENVVIYFKDNVYVVKTLKEFQYIDEDGKDQGANVRQKAKDITNLLADETRLRQERRTRANMRDRMGGGTNGRDDDDDPDSNSRSRRPKPPPDLQLAGKRPNRDEDELRKAIEESKRSLAAEKAKISRADDSDLQEAIRQSEEEEEKRRATADDSNANALFDDHNQLPAPTMTDPAAYTFGLQPQMTFNPYQQQAQQEAMQAEYLRQQQEWQQQQEMQAQAQLQLQAQQEEWQRQQLTHQYQQQQAQQQAQQLFLQQQMQQMQMQQQQALIQQPTGFGSNNPFAPATSPPPLPSFGTQQRNDSPGPTFNLQGTFGQSSTPSYGSSPPAPSPSQNAPVRGPTKADQEHAELANLWANRDDGQDTFGNIGALRYGHTGAGRLALQKTGYNGGGHNPFQHQQHQQQASQPRNPEQPFFII